MPSWTGCQQEVSLSIQGSADCVPLLVRSPGPPLLLTAAQLPAVWPLGVSSPHSPHPSQQGILTCPLPSSLSPMNAGTGLRPKPPTALKPCPFPPALPNVALPVHAAPALSTEHPPQRYSVLSAGPSDSCPLCPKTISSTGRALSVLWACLLSAWTQCSSLDSQCPVLRRATPCRGEKRRGHGDTCPCALLLSTVPEHSCHGSATFNARHTVP